MQTPLLLRAGCGVAAARAVRAATRKVAERMFEKVAGTTRGTRGNLVEAICFTLLHTSEEASYIYLSAIEQTQRTRHSPLRASFSAPIHHLIFGLSY